MRDMIWVTADGDKIPVSNLGDSHVKNVINMIARSKNGDGARDLLNMYLLGLETAGYIPVRKFKDEGEPPADN